MTSSDIIQLIAWLLQVMGFLIIARALLSWFPNIQGNPLVQVVHQLTDPILIPIQRIVPRVGMLDLSPMIATLLLFGISGALLGAA